MRRTSDLTNFGGNWQGHMHSPLNRPRVYKEKKSVKEFIARVFAARDGVGIVGGSRVHADKELEDDTTTDCNKHMKRTCEITYNSVRE